MRIVCPSCSASYEVPATVLGSGRVVRCARCLREWTVPAATAARDGRPAAEPPSAPPAAPDLPRHQHIPDASLTELDATEAEASRRTFERDSQLLPPPVMTLPAETEPYGDGDPTAMDPLTEEGEERARPMKAVAWGAWAASLAVLLLLGWAAYAWRADIVHLWPPSERLYAALGVKVAPN